MKKQTTLFLATNCLLLSMAQAETNNSSDDKGNLVEIGAVLNAGYQDGTRKFSEIEEGFSLGHSEVSLTGNIDDKFRGALTTVLADHEGSTDVELEEAYIETIGLTSGLNIRAGRFLSDFGYLNGRHLHEDSFSSRPAAYRAYLGDHYYDDGVRASYVLPTDHFLSFTLEGFNGEKLASESASEDDFGTINTVMSQIKTGGDINDSNSWQLGFSVLSNKNGATLSSAFQHEEDEHGHEEEHEHEEHAHEEVGHDEHGGEGHSHSAEVTGDRLYNVDLTWKWAPNGNSKNSNLALSAEYLLLDDLFDESLAQVTGAPTNLSGWYLSSVYQFSPQWSAGIRYGEVETYHGHGVEIHDGEAEGNYDIDKLKETDLSVSWHPSHFSKVRANYTRQSDVGHGGTENDNIFMLEYVMSFGAHGAHKY